MGRCLFHKYSTSAPEFFLGAPRSSVASGAGLEPDAPRGEHWRRTYEMAMEIPRSKAWSQAAILMIQ